MMRDWRRMIRVVPRIALGMILAGAGLLKAGDGEAGAESLANYRLLPAQANQILAVVMPWWEIFAGAMLILGLWVRASAGVAAALLAAFALGVASAVVRGLDISCGCFGTSLEVRAGLPHVIANGCLAILAIWIVRRSKEAAPAASSAESREPAHRGATP